MGKPRKVVILGAGFVGLRIGDILSRKGIKVELIEAAPKVGGMVGTFSRDFDGDTYLFDYGPHLFFRDYKDDYQELIGDELQHIEGTFSMMVNGRQLPYPLRVVHILKNLPLFSTFKVATELLCNQLFNKKQRAETIEQWYVSRFGRYLFQTFYAPYIAKSMGISSSQTSVQWATERIHVTGNSLLETIIKRIKTALFKRNKKENLPSSDMITAFYPKHGAGRIGEAMAERIRQNGGTIHLSKSCKNIRIQQGKVEFVSFGTEGEKTSGDYIISTIPLPSLFQAIRPEVSPILSRAASALKYRHLVLMYLIIDKPRVLDRIEVFFPDSNIIFKRIYEPKTLSAELAPPHRTSLCLEICCTEEEQSTDQELFERAIKNLQDYNIIRREDVLQYFTIRLPFAYPIYHLDFAEQRKLLLDYVKSIKNLLTVGRQGLFQYHAMTNECMAMASTMSETIIQHKVDELATG